MGLDSEVAGVRLGSCGCETRKLLVRDSEVVGVRKGLTVLDSGAVSLRHGDCECETLGMSVLDSGVISTFQYTIWPFGSSPVYSVCLAGMC